MLPRLLQALSIRTQLIALSLLVATLALAMTGLTLFSIGKSQQREEIFTELTSLGTLLANRSAAALAFFDDRTAAENLAALKTLPMIGQACMFDAHGAVFSSHIRAGQAQTCSPQMPLEQSHRSIADNVMRIQVPVMTGETLSGALQISTLPAPWTERQAAQSRSLLLALFGALGLSLLPALALAATVSAPVVQIRETTRKIVALSDFSLRAPVIGSNELGDLARAFNAMLATIEQQNQQLEARVELRTAELANANKALKEAIDTLTHTQNLLIQQEKLASLGALVAGVAHELNTPLGVCILGVSTLSEELNRINQKLNDNSLPRSALNQYLGNCSIVFDLLNRNLNHSAELISNFKKIASDQASDQRCQFDPGCIIRDVGELLGPQLRQDGIELVLELESPISMDSYPGTLADILTNLILNAKQHAFTENRGGAVHVSMQSAGPNLQIRVSDDGIGIQPENIERIFDPFFTTKLGQGGSGLGLSIVFNHVNGRLGGYIKVESLPDKGTVFILNLPFVAPQASENDKKNIDRARPV